MRRERTLLLLGLGLATAAAQPATAKSLPDADTPAQEQSKPIQRLATIRANYLKTLIDRKLYDPNIVVAQQPRFPNFSNFKNWSSGWRNS
ncbi:hypothetical protein [Bradyrhizobium prioriisuperbiae]|uniref:hypothetical protein n=1 Tax=Bradyrhizobium prioriisuperbiae TaxID=2854389 RepID=UPI0028EF156C|nr:hypothetical protein [Bradyrhizobium prioritasuperba]